MSVSVLILLGVVSIVGGLCFIFGSPYKLFFRNGPSDDWGCWETPECLSVVKVVGFSGFQSSVPGLSVERFRGVWTYNDSPPIDIGSAKRFKTGEREIIIAVLYVMKIPYQDQTAPGPHQLDNLQAYAQTMIEQAGKSIGGFVPNVYLPDDRVIYSSIGRAQ